MSHPLYGDLGQVWRQTHGHCHLWHDPVDVETDGYVDVFGPDAATADHLVPQSHGGDDHHDTLLQAHLGCNASRGTEDVELARCRVAGSVDAPLSTRERVGLGALVTGLGALVGGALTAKPDEQGRKQLNSAGAWVGGGIGPLRVCAALT